VQVVDERERLAPDERTPWIDSPSSGKLAAAGRCRQGDAAACSKKPPGTGAIVAVAVPTIVAPWSMQGPRLAEPDELVTVPIHVAHFPAFQDRFAEDPVRVPTSE